MTINGKFNLGGGGDVTVGTGSRLTFVGDGSLEINGFEVVPKTKITV